jgi:hypothetical protein
MGQLAEWQEAPGVARERNRRPVRLPDDPVNLPGIADIR